MPGSVLCTVPHGDGNADQQELDPVKAGAARPSARPGPGDLAAENGRADRPMPFKVCQDEVLGRHLVATRDIQPGEVILQEVPLVTGPPLNYHPCCVSCYKHLDQETHSICGKGCGWPVCSEKCAKSPCHKPECDITRNMRRNKITIDVWNEPCPLFECLIVLRCLALRDTNPLLWIKLSRLEAHIAKRKGTDKWRRERDSIALCLRDNFNLDYTEQDIHNICGVVQVNGYAVSLTDPPYIALYDQLSFVEHQCIPNCSKVWNSSGTLTLYSAGFVPHGHHLSICYTNPQWGTAMRRHHLAQELLLCKCTRCSDPAECGTFFSALRCIQQSCDGHVLPEDPVLDVSDPSSLQSELAGHSSWQCDKCGASQSVQQVAAHLEEFTHRRKTLDTNNFDACLKFLEEGLKHFHSNHFYLTDVRIHLAILIGQRPSSLKEVSDDDLQLKIELCKHVLPLADVIFPAVPRVTGLIRFELYRALSEASIRNYNQNKNNSLSLPGSCEDVLQEAKSILKCEPDFVPELFTED